MPPRKVTGAGRQATLSFNHRVTKPSIPKPSAKDAVLLQKTTDGGSDKKLEKVIEKAIDQIPEPEEPEPEPQEPEPEAPKEPQTAQTAQAADTVDERGPLEADLAVPVPVRSAAEIEADAVPNSQVQRYWRSVEARGKSRAVHQEGMDFGEKVLRYFDVSSQYGPCIGIPRKSRWMRAQRLGLAPPIEVLAVIVHEEAKGSHDFEQSSFDRIMNGAVVA